MSPMCLWGREDLPPAVLTTGSEISHGCQRVRKGRGKELHRGLRSFTTRSRNRNQSRVARKPMTPPSKDYKGKRQGRGWSQDYGSPSSWNFEQGIFQTFSTDLRIKNLRKEEVEEKKKEEAEGLRLKTTTKTTEAATTTLSTATHTTQASTTANATATAFRPPHRAL